MSLEISYQTHGRTGNNIFQYLACKIIGYIFGHTYNPTVDRSKGDWVILTDNIFNALSKSNNPLEDEAFKDLRSKNIWCNGYFQKSSLFVKWRKRLIEDVLSTTDMMRDFTGNLKSIKDFMNVTNEYNFNDRDVVMSIRLDDFENPMSKTTDIISPEFYLSIIKSLDFDRLFIVIDKIRHVWETAYLRHFDQFNPIIISGTMEHDSSVMRSAPRLIHSNSSLCWINSFLSEKKERYIPITNFYLEQDLSDIDENDKIYFINPLSHMALKML